MKLDRGRPSQGIGLAPLIDVVFILLLFFMLATNFDHRRSIDVVSRGAAASGDGTSQTALRLHLEQGGMRLNGRRVAEAELPAAIEQLRRSGPAGAELLVTSDDVVPLQSVVVALDRLREAGVSNARLEMSQ